MPYEFYKVLHFLGLVLTLTGLVGLIASYWVGPKELPKKNRLPWVIMHGTGLLIILVSGFGLAARLNYFGNLPTWIHIKILIWVTVGVLLVAVRKLSQKAPLWLSVTILLFMTAAYLAVNKVGA
ncbi:MAG: hypothetical protein ACK5V3_01915 [Bdellovibrionales bacterium]